jgi:hypothetical protein
MYKSQCAASAFYLKSFARRNELFGNYPIIDLSGVDTLPEKARFQIVTTFRDRTIAYGKVGEHLVVNVFMKGDAGKARSFYVNLAGYNRAVNFSEMPKIRADIHEDSMYITDRGKPIDFKEVAVEKKENSITVKIPFKKLGNPKYVLASVNTYTANLPSDFNAWRIIKIE